MIQRVSLRELPAQSEPHLGAARPLCTRASQDVAEEVPAPVKWTIGRVLDGADVVDPRVRRFGCLAREAVVLRRFVVPNKGPSPSEAESVLSFSECAAISALLRRVPNGDGRPSLRAWPRAILPVFASLPKTKTLGV